MVEALTAEGVPEMEQKVESKESPAGRAELMEQEVMAPPRFEGRMSEMVEPLVSVKEVGLKRRSGAPSFTVRSKVVDAVAPPWLVAVMV